MTLEEFKNLKIEDKIKIKKASFQEIVGCIAEVIEVFENKISIELENGLLPREVLSYDTERPWGVHSLDHDIIEKISSWSYERDY
jgi:hypothetical protein